jgi:ParB family chromosome partitioning protein
MPGNNAAARLPSINDILAPKGPSLDDEVIYVDIARLKPFKGHPYQVRRDDQFYKLVDSIKENGILEPVLARTGETAGIGKGEYEIFAGHRRTEAALAAGLKQVPLIRREMDDDTATICMVESNTQRETVLPSEKAFAYKMKMDALKRRRKSAVIDLYPTGRCDAEIARESEDSATQIKRYIRLTHLTKDLLALVDDGKVKFVAGVELSYLSAKEQKTLMLAIQATGKYPGISQAQTIRGLALTGSLSQKRLEEILAGVKTKAKFSLTEKDVSGLFPSSFGGGAEKKKELIKRLLKEHFKKKP